MKSIFIISIILQVTVGEKYPTVKIPGLGQIEGTHRTSFKGKTFSSFEGVPYARPPVGKLRFRDPVPPKPWNGIWKAKTIYKCMQNYHYTPIGEDPVIGDEDCLYLNIYSANLDPNANLDVLVYIHGGAFMFLYGGFQGPEYLLDKNLVFVSLNYRLGPLGFLSTENEVVPGNLGFKDQILALQWVKDNVKYFGGNPNSVTIMGMSAGGASIHFHYLSPKSRGLFQRGISQSGTMFNAWTLQEKPLEKAKKLGENLGCTFTNLEKMVDCLKKRPAKQIVAAVKEYQPWLYNPFSPFGPVVDSWSTDPVLPNHPYNLVKNGKLADLPWLASYTNSEGLYPGSQFYNEQYLEDIDKKWNDLLPFILDYNYTVDSELRDAVSQKIRRYYLGDKKINKESYMDLIKLLSERIFTVDIEKTIRLQASTTKSDVYFYHFTYRGTHSKSETLSGTNKNFGASHGDDTSYVFKTVTNMESTESDRRMIELMTELVASFVKTGVPSVPNEWPPVSKSTKDQLVYLKIAGADNLTVETSVLDSQGFWDSLPIKENDKLYPGIKDEL